VIDMTHALKILIVFAFLLTSISMAFSQDAKSNALDTVLQAMESLATGYVYTAEYSMVQHWTGEDSELDYSTYVTQFAQGEIDADGNYYMTFVFRGSDSPEAIENSPTFEMQLILYDGVQYVSFTNLNQAYPTIFAEMDESWQAVDELISSFGDNSSEQLIIGQLTNITFPTDFPLTDDLITSIEEQESTILDGQTMRVFEVETNARQVFINRNMNQIMGELDNLLGIGEFLTQAEFKLIYTLWSGVDDGLLYQGDNIGYTLLPYLTANQQGIPYDIENSFDATFTITQHGTVDAIELPEELD